MAMLESLIGQFRDQRKALKEMIARMGLREKPAEVQLLTGIQGISVFGAVCIMVDIDRIDRFPNPKKLAAYLSSAPKVDASKTSVRVKGLHKHGRKVAFTTILQSLNHIIKSNVNFKSFSDQKKQGKAACKVRAALVRKTITTIFYMLKNNEPHRFINTATYN